jgi:hypothetical protein
MNPNEDMDLESYFSEDLSPDDNTNDNGVDEGLDDGEQADLFSTAHDLSPAELQALQDELDAQGADGQQEAPPVKMFTVRVNKQDMQIPEHEAPAYIQKGLDYDRVKGQIESLRNDPRIAFVDNLAKQHGMSADEYLTAYEKHQYQSELDDLLSQGIPQNVAQEVLATRKDKIAKAEAERIQKEQEQGKQGLVDFIDYFAKAHGRQFDVNADQIPANVWEAVATGTPLKVAYMEHLVNTKEQEKADLAKKISAEEAKKASRAQAPVRGTGHYGNGASPKKDPLFSGLFEE